MINANNEGTTPNELNSLLLKASVSSRNEYEVHRYGRKKKL